MTLSNYYAGRKSKTFFWENGSPYMSVDRYFKVKVFGRWVSFCKHTIHNSDEDPDCHDHPFHFVSILLRGRYLEFFEGMKMPVPRKAFSIAFRKATTLHRLQLNGIVKPVTFCIKLDAKRDWGFMRDGIWVYWKDYIKSKGMEPIENE